MKNFYSEYASHCLRFYLRNPHMKVFKTRVDKENWEACENALTRYSDYEKKILFRIYSERNKLPSNINKLSQDRDIKSSFIWGLVDDVERNVAKQRGLII